MKGDPTPAERRTARGRCAICGTSLESGPWRWRVFVIATPGVGSGAVAYRTPHHVCTEHADEGACPLEVVLRPSEQELDQILLNAVVAAALELRRGYADWLAEQVRDLVRDLDVATGLYGGEPALLALLNARLTRMRMLQQFEIAEALRSLDDKIEDVNNGVFDNAVEARRHTDDGILRLDGLVREALEARHVFADLEAHGGDAPAVV